MSAPTADRYDNPFERYSYKSPLIELLRAGGGRLSRGRVTVRAARSFGFCWGVDRAVAMVQDALAEQARQRQQATPAAGGGAGAAEGAPPPAPRRLWLLDQIIHNPHVNADFKRQGVHFLRGPFSDAGGEGGSDADAGVRAAHDAAAAAALRPEDVVVIPAFSATVEDMTRLRAAGCTIVDTTCPWVIKPHKRTLKYVSDGFTTLIHGLVRHEETRASCSLIASRGGHYVVVAEKNQAQLVCDVIIGRQPGSRLAEVLPAEALSSAFDPALHLARIGTVNQTTMLASETREIERMVREALAQRDGEEAAAANFRELNTICRATQENQDAVADLAGENELDLLIVVGGYDSSNTRNLTRVGAGRFPSFHVDGPASIRAHEIVHRCPETDRILTTAGWLPAGEITVGFTAGASTPDTLLGETIGSVLAVAGASLDAALAR